MRKTIMVTAPVSSRSGYGAHARDLVWALIAHDRYDIYIEDVRWGNCPRNALDKNNIEHKKILDLYLREEWHLTSPPNIYIDIRIPNEFRLVGEYNIGITAGTETSAVSGKWLEDCNKMDLNIVPSEHSKKGFMESIYDKLQQNPDGSQNKIGEMKLERPMEVLFEGSNTDIYKPLHHKEIPTEFFDWLNDEVPEKFAFLTVGQWSQGGFGEDRKDLGRTIYNFYKTFANKKNAPALILKTHGAACSVMDKAEVLEKINSIKDGFPVGVKLPNIYLFYGTLTDEEMNYLYNHPKVKCMLSLTHGEGFGRPLLEATMTGLPVIAPNWSGQVDFLDSNLSLLIGGELQDIPDSVVWENILIKESKWFVVDEKNVFLALNYVFSSYDEVKRKAKELMDINRKRFSLEAMTEKFKDIMDMVISVHGQKMEGQPKQVGLNLPKLNKSAQTKEIKLPKLKKTVEEV
tara:strand:- start:7676 stop:9055 length:1380 start_codon:yes stop_codon:yes gene_type:complete